MSLVILVFGLFITRAALPLEFLFLQDEFSKKVHEGKISYSEGDYEEAIRLFLEAEKLATSETEFSEIYLNLSLAYYAAGNIDNSKEYLQKFFGVDKDKIINENFFPKGFIDIFHEERNLYLAKLKEEKPVVRKQPGEIKKRKRFPWMVVSAILLAGGSLAALLLSKKGEDSAAASTGSLQVNSSPTGAEVYLDGRSTGKTTNCTLADIHVGNHSVRLVKEGYKDHEETVSVVKGQTAIVEHAFERHTIRVISPASGTFWTKGQEVEIRWEVDNESGSQGNVSKNGRTNSPLNFSFRPLNVNRLRMHQSRAFFRKMSTRRAGGNEEIHIQSYKSDSRTNSSTHNNRLIDAEKTKGKGTKDVLIQPDRSSDRNNRRELLKLTQHSRTKFLGNLKPSGDVRPSTLSNVKIELYKEDTQIETIASSTENDGIHRWIVLSTIEDDSEYRIRISCVGESAIYGESENFVVRSQYQFVKKWGSKGDRDTQFQYPFGITIDEHNFIYIADTLNHRVVKFTPDGHFITKWGTSGEGNSQFQNPGDLAIGLGNIFVVDTWNHRVVKFSYDRDFITKWGKLGSGNCGFHYPNGIALDSVGNVFVADNGNHRIMKFNSNGEFVKKWGSQGNGNYQFNRPSGIAIDSTDNLYITDYKNHRVVKFTSDGHFITKWGSEGKGDYNFYMPAGIAVDSIGNVYVADTYNNRVLKYNSEGEFLVKWGSEGKGNYQFKYPDGISVDRSNNVYVADTFNHRIMKYKIKN
jgi:DNA-binding beta-propeller fold protein YncE